MVNIEQIFRELLCVDEKIQFFREIFVNKELRCYLNRRNLDQLE